MLNMSSGFEEQDQLQASYSKLQEQLACIDSRDGDEKDKNLSEAKDNKEQSLETKSFKKS